MEIELKLRVDPEDVDALRRDPAVARSATAPPQTRAYFSAYFDTPDLRLMRSGFGLRVRRTGPGRWLQTLKDDGRVTAGLHERQEWETPVARGRPELDALRALLRGSRWRHALDDPALDAALAPLFCTRFTRTLWPLRFPDGAEAELALDRGTLRCGAAREPICELELERASGDPVALLDFALALAERLPLRLANASKAERGYAMRAPRPPVAVEAAPVALDARGTVEAALVAVFESAVAHVQGNEAAVAHGASAASGESLHQMRAGVRRLRGAARLFATEAPMPDALRRELAWLGHALGTARDWDVLAERTLASAMAAHPDEPGLAEVRDAARAHARAHRRDAAAAVDSARYARLMLGLTRWLRARAWRDGIDAHARRALDAPVRARGDALLARAHARLLRRWPGADAATPEARHRLRIAARRLRDACAFFACLHGGRRAARFGAALEALQDLLGELNDAAVARRLLRGLAEARPELAIAAAFAAGWTTGRADAEARRLGRRWRRVVEADPPWRD